MNACFVFLLSTIAAAPLFAQQRAPYELPVVYKVPGSERAILREAVVYAPADGRQLRVDVYQPPDLKNDEHRAAIVFVSGGEDVRNWPSYRDWGRLAAAHGFVGLVPEKRYPRGADGIEKGTEDTEALLQFLQRSGAGLGVDANRLAFWHYSGGGQLIAVGLLPSRIEGLPRPKCILSFYAVSDLSREMVGGDEKLLERSPARALESLGAKAPPIFVARAGQDNPRLNQSIDAFIGAGLKTNAPLTVINYPDGQHGFDTLNETDEARAIIKAAFEFVQRHTETRS